MRPGLVTFQIAQDWDLNTIIDNCEKIGLKGVELRTTHAHGVEVSLSAEERKEVKKKFEDSPVELVGLGSIFEYHYPDPSELKKHIEGTKEYVKLARDVGASGVKVRPNKLPPELSEEKALEQIGKSFGECAAFAADYGIELRLEVHGPETARLFRIRKILDWADHPNAKVCWNCNPEDLEDGGLKANFDMISEKISLVHTRDLCDENYPYCRLFQKLKEIEYKGYCLAEIPASPDPVRVLRYYRAVLDTFLFSAASLR